MNIQLRKMIAEGEHQQQDFKYCINDSRKIAISLVAFANTDGGRLLLGVRDNGSIAGVSSEEEYYMAEAAAKLYSKPAVPFSFNIWKTEGKSVLEIKIEKSGSRPHLALDHQGKWLAYIRIGDQNILAPSILMNIWKQQKNPQGVHIRFSSEDQLILSLLKTEEGINLAQLAEKVSIPKWKLGKMLVKLIVIGVIEMQNTIEGPLFSLNEKDVNKSILK